MVTVRLTDKHDALTFGQWYASTYDVLVGRGLDDEYEAVVVASFERRADANAYANACAEYVIGVRPPADAFGAALDWLTLLARARSDEGIPLTRGRGSN